MKQPRCACVHPDARECYRRRYDLDLDDEDFLDRDERCECYCHGGDEDGFTAWDDEGEP